jgi:hypothetical protein
MVALPPGDPGQKAAAFLADLARSPTAEEWPWLEALADEPSIARADPRTGAASYLAEGTGTVFARTAWTPDAVWMALSCSPSLSDHQHLDNGHVALVRGKDPLLIDSGGTAYSTLSHNTVAVDDELEHMNYAPSQGTWSKARIARFEDARGAVYALCDFSSANNPAGYPEWTQNRSVTRAERELLFSRTPVSAVPGPSARLVLYDRITLAKPAYAATFLLHGDDKPVLSGARATLRAGSSGAWITPLLPSPAMPIVVTEPTVLGEGPYYDNTPPDNRRGPTYRLEVPSPKGSNERRFLHTVVAGGWTSSVPLPERLDAAGAAGVALDGEAYVFAADAPQSSAATLSYEAPLSAARHFIAALAPAGVYRVSVSLAQAARCRVVLEPAPGLAASAAGVLALDVSGCLSARPLP